MPTAPGYVAGYIRQHHNPVTETWACELPLFVAFPISPRSDKQGDGSDSPTMVPVHKEGGHL